MVRTWDLMVVGGPEAMILGVAIEEHPELQERVRAVLYAWDHRSRRESRLIDVTMVVLRVLVKVELAKFLHLLSMTISNNPESYWVSVAAQEGELTGNWSLGQTLVTSKGSNPNFRGSASSGSMTCTHAVYVMGSPRSTPSHSCFLE